MTAPVHLWGRAHNKQVCIERGIGHVAPKPRDARAVVGPKFGMELQAAVPAQEDCLAVVLRQNLHRRR